MAPQQRHKAKVDLTIALRRAKEALDDWEQSMQHQGASLYSGGLLDSWPAKVVEEQGILKSEWVAVQAFLMSEKEGDNGA